MDKISTPYRNTTSRSVQSKPRLMRSTPAASTIAFLRQFARTCYVDVNLGPQLPAISLN